MFAIFKKELRSYFMNAIGYVYIGVFLALSGLLCCYTTLAAQSYDTSSYFSFMIISFIILIPLLTMKLFAEEKKLRTEQMLLTAPVSLWGMVFGKFLAAFTLFVSGVLVSCINLCRPSIPHNHIEYGWHYSYRRGVYCYRSFYLVAHGKPACSCNNHGSYNSRYAAS